MSELTDKQWQELVEDAAYYEELNKKLNAEQKKLC